MLEFKDILGHEQIKEHFQNAAATGKVSHAYILSGEESPKNTVGSKINDRSDKSEMPVVPKVNVDRTGRFR